MCLGKNHDDRRQSMASFTHFSFDQNDSISMMQNRDYSSLDQLLNLQELNALHIYIFLLCWTHARTINDATVLLGSIRTLVFEYDQISIRIRVECEWFSPLGEQKSLSGKMFKIISISHRFHRLVVSSSSVRHASESGDDQHLSFSILSLFLCFSSVDL